MIIFIIFNFIIFYYVPDPTDSCIESNTIHQKSHHEKSKHFTLVLLTHYKISKHTHSTTHFAEYCSHVHDFKWEIVFFNTYFALSFIHKLNIYKLIMKYPPFYLSCMKKKLMIIIMHDLFLLQLE